MIMAGTYAHIMLVDTICQQNLSSIPTLSATMRQALQNYTPFCKLGAVSPDCPSLVGATGPTGYGKVMHYLRTADFVRYVIPQIHAMNFSLADTRACIAWIFGYAAHLVTDLTIHPVISRKFGAYAQSAQNRKKHRLCELHQDVHLYSKLYAHEIVGSNFLQFSGLTGCSVSGNTNKLSPAIVNLWAYCLQKHPRSEIKQYVRLPDQSLKPNNWYATFLNLFQNIVTKGLSFLQGGGYAYPNVSALNPVYLTDLPTASGKTIDYDALFQTTIKNVMDTWGSLAEALDSNKPDLFKLPNANLDTGLADASGQPVFVV
jgi:hypothetical protein